MYSSITAYYYVNVSLSLLNIVGADITDKTSNLMPVIFWIATYILLSK